MSADLLREAAALMRARAKAATPGPWDVYSTATTVGVTTSGKRRIAYHTTVGELDPLPVAENAVYLASWHPAVALAVADWLDEAAGASEFAEPGSELFRLRYTSLAVARAYLGRDA